MPQQYKRNDKTDFSPQALFRRSPFLTQIGLVNALWARIDQALGVIVIRAASMKQFKILHAHEHLPFDEAKVKLLWQAASMASNMYLALSGSASRDAALSALLGPDDSKRFEPLLNRVKSIRTQRNRIIHGIFGLDPDIPDGIIIQELQDSLVQRLSPRIEAPWECCWLYKRHDFLFLLKQIDELLNDLHLFHPEGGDKLVAQAAQRASSGEDHTSAPQAHQQTSPQGDDKSRE